MVTFLLANVPANATKYTPAGGEIRIETLREGDADRERSQAAGFDAHLVKPAEFATLQRVIAQMG